MTPRFSERCLCGAVTYTANGTPVVVAQCHCEQCRRLSGTGHTTGAMFASHAVVVNGPLRAFTYLSELGSEVTKEICEQCGSPILGRNTRLPGHVTLTLGTIDDAAGIEIQVVIFERDAQHWDRLGPQVTSFASQPDWTPES